MRSLVKFLLFFVVFGVAACALPGGGGPDLQKGAYLRKYAPRVYLHSNEKFWPSSVRWSFSFLDRSWSASDKEWWLVTRQRLSEPSSILSYFYGTHLLEDVPVYAFWNDLAPEKVVDLVYFFYYPYNRGKEVINTVFGSHVGDWEHVTVRLTQQQDSEGRTTLAPSRDVVSFYLEAHGNGTRHTWSEVPKVEGTEHPIVYSAAGSHGLYLKPGRHTYDKVEIPIPFIPMKIKDLVDDTDSGTAWNTWNEVEYFDYNLEKRLALSGGCLGPMVDLYLPFKLKRDVPNWLKKDDKNSNRGNTRPASGPITRWGNGRRDEWFGEYRLERGPTGPVDKPCFETPEPD